MEAQSPKKNKRRTPFPKPTCVGCGNNYSVSAYQRNHYFGQSNLAA